MTASRSASGSIAWSKSLHLLKRPGSDRFRVPDERAEARLGKIGGGVHRASENPVPSRWLPALHAMARKTLRDEHRLAAPRRRIRRQVQIHLELWPAVSGTFGRDHAHKRVGPLLAAHPRPLRVLPHQEEWAGTRALPGNDRPGMARRFEGDPRGRAPDLPLRSQGERDLGDETVGRARLERVEMIERQIAEQGQQRYGPVRDGAAGDRARRNPSGLPPPVAPAVPTGCSGASHRRPRASAPDRPPRTRNKNPARRRTGRTRPFASAAGVALT